MFIVIKDNKLPAGHTSGANEGLCIFENLFEMGKFTIRLVRLVVDTIDPESDFALDVVGRQQRSKSFPESGFSHTSVGRDAQTHPAGRKVFDDLEQLGMDQGIPIITAEMNVFELRAANKLGAETSSNDFQGQVHVLDEYRRATGGPTGP